MLTTAGKLAANGQADERVRLWGLFPNDPSWRWIPGNEAYKFLDWKMRQIERAHTNDESIPIMEPK